MDDQSKTLVITAVTLIAANWVSLYPIIRTAITFTWKKTIEWQKIVDIQKTHTREIAQLQRDVKAAHDKIRSFKP